MKHLRGRIEIQIEGLQPIVLEDVELLVTTEPREVEAIKQLATEQKPEEPVEA